MADVIRLSKVEKDLIHEFYNLRLEYLKSRFEIDSFYREEYERMKKCDESKILMCCLVQAVSDYKYKMNYED